MPQISANGLQLEYESFGKESDPVILLIMGFAAQMIIWPLDFCQDLAKRGYRVIRFDNRDIGKSSKLDHLGPVNALEAYAKYMMGAPVTSPYTLDDMAADAAGLLTALGIKDAHIVGASMGGMIAQTFAINHKSKLRSLISVMSTTGRRDLPMGKPEVLAVLMSTPENLERNTRINHAKKVFKALSGDGPYAVEESEMQRVAEAVTDRTPFHPEGIARQLVAVVASPPRHETLRAVNAPALVIHGSADPIFPVECAQDTAKSIPGARLKIIDGLGHDITEKSVSIYVREIADFIAEVDAKRVK